MGTLGVIAALLAVLFALGATLPVPYVVLGPGPSFNTLGSIDGRQIITVEGREVNDSTGNLNLTTVSVADQLELIRAVQGWIDPEENVVPREEVFPPDQTTEETDQQNRQDFINSQNSAEAAALGELGYPLRVVVAGVPDGSPSLDRLQADDVLDSVNGTAVADAEALVGVLTALAPGDSATVGFTRLGTAMTTRITTTEATDRDGAALGIQVSFERAAPFTVSINVADVGGPSAGLMLTLGILDLVGDTDLVDGMFVAGTGTIDADGVVGRIGGIPLKLIAAERLGADVFLVPEANCADAVVGAPEGLPLAVVATLDDALTALADLRAGDTPRLCPTP